MINCLRQTVAISLCFGLLIGSPGAQAWAQARAIVVEAPITGPRIFSLPQSLPLAPQAFGLELSAAPAGLALPSPVEAPAAASAQLIETASELLKAGAEPARVLERAFSGARIETTREYAAAAAAALETQILPVPAGQSLAARVAGSFARLPSDAFRPKGAPGARFRAAAELEIRPGEALRVTPGASFRSASGEAGYSGIALEVVADQGFRDLILSLYNRLPEEARRRGARVSVHQTRVVDGAVVPEGLHQDPFTDYIGIWSAGRTNAEGGESLLYGDALGKNKTLSRVLGSSEALLFDNRTLWHDVTPIKRADPKAGPAQRDVFIFAFSVLPPASGLTEAARRAGTRVIHEELAKAKPDVEKLRALYQTGDVKLQKNLYHAFKRWGRFFSVGEADWKFVKSAASPWASYVIVKKMKSYLEFLNEAYNQQIDVEKKTAEVHEAGRAFAESFVKAAEKAKPQGLDPEETADVIADSVLYPAVLEPVISGAQKGAFDRKTLLAQTAQRLKDTVYLYTPTTVEEIAKILEDSKVGADYNRFVELIEALIPPSEPGTGEAKKAKGGVMPALKKAVSSGGAKAALVLGLAWAAQALFGVDPAWTGAGAFMLGSIATAQPAPKAELPAPAAAAPAAQDSPAYLSDLTAMARRGELAPIYLREQEIGKVVQILNQKAFNNVFLIGETGVGKTAIAEGLAQAMADGQTGTDLDNQRMMLLDVGKFMAVAGAGPDALAAAVENLVRLTADGRTTLVIDEAQQLARDPNVPLMFGSFFDQIRQVMTQGRLKLVLATTLQEHAKYFASDKALASRSQIVAVAPIAEGAAVELAYRIRGQFERGVTVSFQAAKAAVELTVRAFRFDALLRMALKALDTAATRLRLRPSQVKLGLRRARKDLLYSVDLLRQARRDKDLEREESLVPQINGLLGQYLLLQQESLKSPRTELGREDVAEALQELGAPIHSLKAGTQEHLSEIEAYLKKNLIGREALIEQTSSALKRRFAEPNSRKPIFKALLLGPTGTGKTEFARLLGRALYHVDDVEKSTIKIDGGTLQERHEISRIQGSPPGYVGFNETETLMDQVRRRPESIILVDEVEKMHPDILNLFLSILEDGTAKDALGRPVDFSHTVIVLTSNFGLPAGYEKLPASELIARVRERVKQPFPASPFKPEFLNRLDLTEVFPMFSEEETRKIVDLRLTQLTGTWKTLHGVDLQFSDREATINAVLSQYEPRNGARSINRVLAERLEAPLSSQLIAQTLKREDRVIVGADWAFEIAAASKDRRAPSLSAPGEQGKALVERLEALLSTRETALDLDALDRALATDLDVASSKGFSPRVEIADFIADGKSEALSTHTPNQADAALKKALDALKEAVGKRPEAKPEPLLTAVKALALKAKRLNLEASARKTEGASWQSDFDMMEAKVGGLVESKKAALQARLNAVVTAANAEHKVGISWQLKTDKAVVELEADSRLTYEEEEKLAALMARSPAPEASEDEAKPRDWAVVQAREAMLSAGGRMGYSKRDGATVLWLEWPIMPAEIKPEVEAQTASPEPAAPAAEIAPTAAAAPETQGIVNSAANRAAARDRLLTAIYTLKKSLDDDLRKQFYPHFEYAHSYDGLDGWLAGANYFGTDPGVGLQFLKNAGEDIFSLDFEGESEWSRKVSGIRINPVLLRLAQPTVTFLTGIGLFYSSAEKAATAELYMKSFNTEELTLIKGELAVHFPKLLNTLMAPNALLPMAPLAPEAELISADSPAAPPALPQPAPAPSQAPASGLVKTFGAHEGGDRVILPSPDGKYLYTGDVKGTVGMWDAAEGTLLRQFTGHAGGVLSLALSPDGSRLFVGSDEHAVRMWDTATGRELRRFSGDASRVYSLAISPDGAYLFTAGNDYKVQMWDVVTGDKLLAFQDTAGDIHAKTIALSPDGQRVFATSGANGLVRSWDTVTGQEMGKFSSHLGSVNAIAVSADGLRLFTAGQDGSARKWDVATGAMLQTFNGSKPVISLALSPDGSRLLTGDDERTLRQWDTLMGTELRKIEKANTRSIALTPDGKGFFASSYIGNTGLWMIPGMEVAPAPQLTAEELEKRRLSVERRAAELSLVRHAQVLLNGNSPATAIVESANALRKGLRDNKELATPALEQALWRGIEAYRGFLAQYNNNDNLEYDTREAMPDSAVVKLGGRRIPERRTREAFALYRALLEARPDLTPADIAARLSSGLGVRRIRYSSTYYRGWHYDRNATHSAQWFLKQTADLVRSVSKARSDMLSLSTLSEAYRSLKARLAERRKFDGSNHNGQQGVSMRAALRIGLTIAATVAAAVAGIVIATPSLAAAPAWAALAVSPAVLAAYAAVDWLLAWVRGSALRKSSNTLLEQAIAKAKTMKPLDVLDLIGEFDADREKWFARDGNGKLFGTLMRQWPEFKAAARPPAQK